MRPPILGRRGATLLGFAAVFSLFAVQALLDPLAEAGRFVFYAALPSEARAVLWAAPAALAAIAAFRPGGRDGFGFVALTIPTTVLAFSYFWSFVGHLLGVTDWALGWTYGLNWSLLLLLILILSGWAEPERPRRRRHRGGPPK